MSVKELKEQQQRAYLKLKKIEDGVDYETEADIYSSAFEIVDAALCKAIKQIEQSQPAGID